MLAPTLIFLSASEQTRSLIAEASSKKATMVTAKRKGRHKIIQYGPNGVIRVSINTNSPLTGIKGRPGAEIGEADGSGVIT